MLFAFPVKCQFVEIKNNISAWEAAIFLQDASPHEKGLSLTFFYPCAGLAIVVKVQNIQSLYSLELFSPIWIEKRVSLEWD